jgi:hypothetical protein
LCAFASSARRDLRGLKQKAMKCRTSAKSERALPTHRESVLICANASRKSRHIARFIALSLSGRKSSTQKTFADGDVIWSVV